MSKFADIALPLPVFQNYTYEIPENMEQLIKPGFRVLVPLGKRKMTGYVVAVKNRCDRRDLKTIHDILDPEQVISEELLNLASWISSYYICSLGEAIKAMLPGGINLESKTFIKLIKPQQEIEDYLQKNHVPRQEKILNQLKKHNQITVQQLRRQFRDTNLSSSIEKLSEAGLIKQEIHMTKNPTRIKYENWIKIGTRYQDLTEFSRLLQRLEDRSPAQARCLNIIHQKKEISLKDLLKLSASSSGVIQSLVEKEYAIKFKKEVFRSYYQTSSEIVPLNIMPNEYQRRAIYHIHQAVEEEKFKTFLIHGVTGSGKTQVYIEAIKKVLTKNKSAIVLVPEISLTPQTVNRFTQNFPNQVAVLHSRMSSGERYDSWRKLKQGEFKIAIGPRSAIFAPLINLGLIVVDEEHESSYKQYEGNPLYNARDVAVYRGKLNEATVILGSATPSVESYYNARTQKYHLLELPLRIDDIPMPKVEIVNMAQERKRYPGQDVSIISKTLQQKIAEKLSRKEQIIVLQNRRGFSTYIKCKDCGYIEKCEHCEITLTYHSRGHRLRCHYCNFNKMAPTVCPNCQGHDILYRGIGTQKVEEQINKLFPEARVVRMDLDTTRGKWAHDKILTDFGKGKFDILLGTQMIAKGLDFHNVTLVGVISADTSLLLPDFRSTERTFQLLTQVSGRAGRKQMQGEVLIQTYSPDNVGLKFAKSHDFKSFFYNELPMRQQLTYPPFGRLVYILFKGENEDTVKETADTFFDKLNFPDSSGKIFGPSPSPLLKIQDQYRWQLIIKSDKKKDPSGKFIIKCLTDALTFYKSGRKKRGVKISIDIDPISLL